MIFFLVRFDFELTNNDNNRWFNHISAAAEAYKQRTKNNHDIVTSMEDPSSVTIPSGTAKETADHEFLATSAANLTLNASNASTANATTEGTPHNPAQDGRERSDSAQHSTSHDNEAFERMAQISHFIFAFEQTLN